MIDETPRYCANFSPRSYASVASEMIVDDEVGIHDRVGLGVLELRRSADDGDGEIAGRFVSLVREIQLELDAARYPKIARLLESAISGDVQGVAGTASAMLKRLRVSSFLCASALRALGRLPRATAVARISFVLARASSARRSGVGAVAHQWTRYECCCLLGTA